MKYIVILFAIFVFIFWLVNFVDYYEIPERPPYNPINLTGKKLLGIIM